MLIILIVQAFLISIVQQFMELNHLEFDNHLKFVYLV